MAGGRPTIFTQELAEEIADQLAHGTKQLLIAKAIGVSEPTLSRWINQQEFQKKLAVKRLEVKKHLHMKVFTSDNPKDAQWLLERMHREEYAPPTNKNEVTGSLKVEPIQLQVEFINVKQGTEEG